MQNKAHIENFVIKMEVTVKVQPADLSAADCPPSGSTINSQHVPETPQTNPIPPAKWLKLVQIRDGTIPSRIEANFAEKRQHPRRSAGRRKRLLSPWKCLQTRGGAAAPTWS